MNKLKVNKEQSRRIGKLISHLEFKDDFLKRPFLMLKVSDEIKAAMYYYAVGICHQTYHLANDKLNLYGWDYLEYGFMDMAVKKPELFQAQYISKLKTDQLIGLIQPFFSPTGKPEDCSLDTLEERASLWLDMAQLIKKSGDSHLEFFLKSKDSANDFYEKLSRSTAYSDPFQKKTSFLMKLLEDAKLMHFSKDQSLIPIMDYHMQRVLLRTGCVEVLDKSIEYDLKNKIAMNDDSAIRAACIESMLLIAQAADLSVFKMNDVFYTMGRSCCNENMLCQSGKCEKSPCSLSLSVVLESHQRCLFQDICKGSYQEEYRKYWQPQIQTHFY